MKDANAVGIEWCGRTVSFGQLDAAAGAVAERLVRIGAARASVLVMGPLCPAYLVGLLAAWRAGAVPVPVDTGLSADRYAWLERQLAPVALVSSDVTAVEQYRAVTTGTTELVLDAATGAIIVEAGPDSDCPARTFDDPDASYVIPTSGSTGEPKAVVGSRRGLEDFLDWFRDEFQLTAADRCAAITRVNFDPSLRELLGVLGAGGTLVLPPVDAQLDPRALADHLIDARPTLAFLVPSLAVRIAGDPRLAETGLPDLRLIFFAGESLSERVVREWARIAPGAEIVNLYGQTEATLAQLFRRDVQLLDTGGTATVPVGGPRPGIGVELSEPDDSGLGELLLVSDTPALGVLTPGAGPHRITPIPSPLPTGDMGYLAAEGDWVVLGRAGNDLKVAGSRVSFHRFVTMVERLPAVRQCVVVDRDGPHVFVALGTATDATSDASEALRATVSALGADLKLPRFGLHLHAELPMLRSGKVDRQALTALAGPVEIDSAAHPAAPESDCEAIERTLRAILGIGSGAAGFVDSGVGSLDMFDVVAAVHRRYGVRLTVPECFALREVPALAAEIMRRRGDAATRDSVAADHRPSEVPGSYPLSTRQRAYMWVCMSGGNANWCNLSREIQGERPYSEAEVVDAVRALLARHDALGLALDAGWNSQIYTPAAALECPLTVVNTAVVVDSPDFRGLVQSVRARQVAELIDPTAPPPLRIVLVRGRDGCSTLLVAHHLFVDGLGMDVLARELRELLSGRRLEPVSPGDSYRDYCVATARSESPGPAAAYWRKLLAGVEQFRLPEASGDDSAVGELRSLPLGAMCTRAVHVLAEESGVSAFTVVLAAFERAVAETIGIGRLPIVVASQHRATAGPAAVGNFTSTLIVYGSGSTSLLHSISEIASQLAAGTEHGDWEFDQRVADLGLDAVDCFPISTVLFNQHPMARALRARELGSWQPRSLGRSLRYQLQGELQMSGPEMVMTYYYRRGIAGGDVIDRVHAALLRTVLVGREVSR
ncbi:AMP-binding protein [Nocardia sp. NPDC046763]|uniref:AMP-binding protein n=1 Tax=Nocardia sp. NPDC046763 TaxID=3155256 RepID=UPI0033F0E3C5